MASPESARIRAMFQPDPAAPEPSLDQMRREWHDATAQATLPDGISWTAVDLDGVAGEWIRGPALDERQTLLYLHGGGYNAGSCVTHRDLAARLCLAGGVAVLLLDYRLAPEHPFPAAVEDATAAYQRLLDDGFQPDQLLIGGDSSGAGLALATLLRLRELGQALPRAGVLLSPWLDLALTGPTLQTNAPIDPLTTAKGLRRAAQWYLGSADPRQPLASPLYGDLHGLPPLLIQAGSDEILLSDSTRFAEKARAAGVEVTLEIWPEMWHVWQAFAAQMPEARQAIERIGQFIRQHSADAAPRAVRPPAVLR